MTPHASDSPSSTPPTGEYEKRIANVRKAMAAEGYDAIIAFDPGHWMLPSGHVRYLTNFSIGSYPGVIAGTTAVLPLDGELSLLLPSMGLRYFAEWAHDSAWPSKVRSTIPSKSWPPVDDICSEVVAALQDAGLERARIGLCGVFPGSSALSSALPNATFETTEKPDGRGTPRDLLERVRRVKTDWEITQLMAAQRSADAAMRAFMRAVEDGKLQRAAIAEAEWAAKSLGSEDALIIMNSGIEPFMWWHVQGDRQFKDGDLIALEANARNQGYAVQVARSGVLGEPNELQRRLLDTASNAQSAMVGALRPGATGADVFAAGERVIREQGFEIWGRLGHGMGLSMAEGFDILPGDDFPLEDNTTLVIHAVVRDPASRSLAIIGEQYCVKDGKPLALSNTVPPRDLAPGKAFSETAQ